MSRYKVTLTKEEREYLGSITKKGKHPSQKVRKALILLNCDERKHDEKSTNEVISKVLHVGMRTIDRVKKRFVEEGLEAVLGGKPSGRVYQRKIDGDAEAHLIALSCSDPPEGFCRWSLRLLASQMIELEYVDDVSHETVRQVLKKTNLSLGK